MNCIGWRRNTLTVKWCSSNYFTNKLNELFIYWTTILPKFNINMSKYFHISISQNYPHHYTIQHISLKSKHPLNISSWIKSFLLPQKTTLIIKLLSFVYIINFDCITNHCAPLINTRSFFMSLLVSPRSGTMIFQLFPSAPFWFTLSNSLPRLSSSYPQTHSPSYMYTSICCLLIRDYGRSFYLV